MGAERLRPLQLAGGACVRFLVAPPGALVEVRGLDAVRDVAGVRAVHAYRSPGHRFGELRRASDRAGAVLATGATREEARAAAAEAAACVEFVTEPVEAIA